MTFLLNSNAIAQVLPDYSVVIANNEKNTYSRQGFAFIVHSSEIWDVQKTTMAGTKRFIQFIKNNTLTSFGIVSPNGGPIRPFFEPQDLDYIMQSDAGQHRLEFPNARALFFAGGHLSLCLCETIRDSIRGKWQNPLFVFLVSDAIYDDTEKFGNSPSLRSPKFTLEDLVNAAPSSSSISEYFARKIFGENGKPFCPEQNWYKLPDLDKTSLGFSLYVGTQKIIENEGQQKINFVIVRSHELAATVKALSLEKFLRP